MPTEEVKRIAPGLATTEVGGVAIVLPKVYAVHGIKGPDTKGRFYFSILTPPIGGGAVYLIEMKLTFRSFKEAVEAREHLIKEVNRHHMDNLAYSTRKQQESIASMVEGMLSDVLPFS
jgi:hypothetical protein